MKSLKTALFAIAIAGLFGSCKKSFLDLKPYDALTLTDALGNEANLNTAVNGMYTSLRSGNLYGRTLPLKGDLMADNVYIKPSNSGRYLDFNEYNIIASNGNANGIYADAYTVIKNANTVIGSTLPANANINQFKGEAYAVRALMYFELVRNFAKPYTVDPNGLGVPVVTSFNQDILPSRASSKEVYKQILDDLNQAYTLMTVTLGGSMTISETGTTRTLNSSYFTKYAARALQAKVYMHTGDWAAAKTAALDVLNNSGASLVSGSAYASYWKNPTPLTNKVETLFEVSSDVSGNLGTGSLPYFYDPAGYGDAVATTDLYNQYSATDVRKQLIVSSGGFLVVTKYPNISNANDKDDAKVLRLSDALLIMAEAYARTGDEPNALLRLNQLATNRDASFSGYAATGAPLLAAIVAERRKEFAFEGDRFFDLQRLNLPITKVRRENPLLTLTIAPDDYRRIFPIPQAELDVNPNIRGQQNPGY